MPDQVVTSEELADLRGAIESWMPDTCTIYGHPSEADDDYGGQTYSPEIVKASDVQCTIESGAEHEQTRAMIAQEVLSQTFSITLPAGTDIEVDDHIVVTSREDLHLRVTAVIAPESWEIERRVLATVLGEHSE